MMRIVKDSTGKTIAFGPAVDNYAPIAPQGGTVIDDATIVCPPDAAFVAAFRTANGIVSPI